MFVVLKHVVMMGIVCCEIEMFMSAVGKEDYFFLVLSFTHPCKIYCGGMELSDSKIARALNVDRRVIAATIDIIQKNPELNKVFSQLHPTCHLRDVATAMKWGVIEIIPEDPSMPGILAEVAAIIADNNIIVRQAIVDDFELSEEPRLFIVTEKQIPGVIIPKIRKAKWVKAVLIY
jgi:predicted regulator of amino acid metabolism with ACT domain